MVDPCAKRQRPDYWYVHSAVLPYLYRDGELRLVLVSTRKGKRWTLPKGVVEPGLSPLASAEKEALEEAGIRGKGSPRSLGVYTRRKWGGECRIEVFPFEVTEVLDVWEERWRQRRVLRPDEALQLLGDGEASDIVRDFVAGHEARG